MNQVAAHRHPTLGPSNSTHEDLHQDLGAGIALPIIIYR